jgi:hypothetical protein
MVRNYSISIEIVDKDGELLNDGKPPPASASRQRAQRRLVEQPALAQDGHDALPDPVGLLEMGIARQDELVDPEVGVSAAWKPSCSAERAICPM